jgi:site-specific DNA-methyltransferase (adenine-specific)
MLFNLDVIEFLDKVEDNSVDLVIADPPYNQGLDYWDNFKNESDYFDFMHLWLEKVIPKMKKNSSIYLFNNPRNSAYILDFLEKKGLIFQNWIIWHKKDGFSSHKRRFNISQEVILFFSKGNKYVFNYDDVRVPYESEARMLIAKSKGILKNGKRWYPNPNGKLCTDVWTFTSDRHKKKHNGRLIKGKHPTPKPEDLIQRIIMASSNSGDLVMDLFSGTGTTSYVAKKSGRDFIGCELDYEYFELALERLNQVGKIK